MNYDDYRGGRGGRNWDDRSGRFSNRDDFENESDFQQGRGRNYSGSGRDRDFERGSQQEGYFGSEGRGQRGDYGGGRDWNRNREDWEHRSRDDIQGGRGTGSYGASSRGGYGEPTTGGEFNRGGYGGSDYNRGMYSGGSGEFNRGSYGGQGGGDFNRGAYGGNEFNRGPYGATDDYNRGSFRGSEQNRGMYGSAPNVEHLPSGWGAGGGYGQGGVNWGPRRLWGTSSPDVDTDRSNRGTTTPWRTGNLGMEFGRNMEYPTAGSFAGRGPRGYRRSDERIREDVSEELTRDHRIDASGIDVTVENAEVTLAGEVETRHDKRLAEEIAESIPGVRDVHNKIKARHGLLASLFGTDEEGKESRREGESATAGSRTQGSQGSTGSTSGTTGTSGSTRNRTTT